MTPPTTTLAAVEGAVVTIVVELTMSIEEIVHVPLAHVAAAHVSTAPPARGQQPAAEQARALTGLRSRNLPERERGRDCQRTAARTRTPT